MSFVNKKGQKYRPKSQVSARKRQRAVFCRAAGWPVPRRPKSVAKRDLVAAAYSVELHRKAEKQRLADEETRRIELEAQRQRDAEAYRQREEAAHRQAEEQRRREADFYKPFRW